PLSLLSRYRFSSVLPAPPRPPPFPYTTLFRSARAAGRPRGHSRESVLRRRAETAGRRRHLRRECDRAHSRAVVAARRGGAGRRRDRKSTRLNSSHQIISYAVFCLKNKYTSRTC